MRDLLDRLMDEVQGQLSAERSARKIARQSAELQSSFRNPDNWVKGRVILMIHCVEGEVGVFREWLFPRQPGLRRLLPEEGQPAETTEVVNWNLTVKAVPPPYVESPEEEAAIKARFLELLDAELEAVLLHG